MYSTAHKFGRLIITVCVFAILTSSCKSSGRSGEFDILGPADETPEAGKLVAEANQDLNKIKILYNKNEGKREELKKAIEANNADEVKKISDDVVYTINEGFDAGKGAVDKIEQAEELKINDDYKGIFAAESRGVKKADGSV